MFDYVVGNSQKYKNNQTINTSMKAQVTIGTTFEMNVASVEILDRPVQDTIVAAGYSGINPNILKSETLAHKPGTRPMAIWHPNRSISSGIADEAMKSMTVVINGETYKGRPAIIEELASYEAMFHEELGEMILVALGEKVLGGGSSGYGAYRDVRASERKLRLNYLVDGWSSRSCFLVVFEKISGPE